MSTHQSIDRIEDTIARTSRMSVEEMVNELNIRTTRNTYLYIDTRGELIAIEKPYTDTYPADEAKSIGYARTLRGSFA